MSALFIVREGADFAINEGADFVVLPPVHPPDLVAEACRDSLRVFPFPFWGETLEVLPLRAFPFWDETLDVLPLRAFPFRDETLDVLPLRLFGDV